MENRYRCAKCNALVDMLQGVPFRDCHCPANTGITADVSGTVRGHGGIVAGTPVEQPDLNNGENNEA